MPVSKERLLALVNAARDFREALLLAEQIVQKEVRKVLEGQSNPASALGNIEVFVNHRTLPTDFAQSDKILDLEWKDLRRNWARNERSANKHRRERGQELLARTRIIVHGDKRLEAVPIGSTSPKSIVPQGRLVDRTEAMLLGKELEDEATDLDAEVEAFLKEGTGK